jgi:type III secretory pathway component EscT
LAALLTGLVAGAVQAVTQIHDHAVGFVPRLIVMLLVLMVLGPYLGAQVVRFQPGRVLCRGRITLTDWIALAAPGQPGVTALLLVGARVMPMMVMLPAFGAPMLPRLMRVGFGATVAVWLTFALVPDMFQKAVPELQGFGTSGFLIFFVAGARELAIGVALAWLGSLVFVAVEVAGRLSDVARRADGPTLAAPFSAEGESVTALAALYPLMAALLFAELGGPGRIMAALLRSYEVLPLDLGPSSGASPPLGLIALVAATMSGVVEVAVGLAAPVLVAVWLVDLLFALVSRLVGRSAESVGPILNAAAPLVGLGAVLLALGVVRASIEGWVMQIPVLILRAAGLWAHD